ncbi:MAG: hypothetical protein HXY20_06240 [Acidobacteria bacterium]|nr:hypothetical protein [Acidobacteriota bacterium]
MGLAVLAVGSVLAMGSYTLDRIVILQLAMVFGSASLTFLFQCPQAGLALLLVGGILVRQEIATGTHTGLHGAVLMSAVLIAVWLVHHVFERERHGQVFSRTIVPLNLFMVTALLAFLVGQYPWFPVPPASLSAQLGQLAIFLFSGGLFLVAAHYLQDTRWLKGIAYFFIGAGSIHLAFRLLPGLLSSLGAFLPDAVTRGSMFWTWLVALSAGQAIMNRELRLIPRLTMAAVALTAIFIGLTQLRTWVSGWFPPVLSVLVILLLRFPIPILAAAPAIVFLSLLSAGYFTDLATAGDNLYSYETRVAAMKSLFPLLAANPVLGLGPANYYHYTLLYPILGWYIKFNSHNNYLDLIGQTGLVGLALFLWFACAVLRTAWKHRSQAKEGFERAYVYSVLAGLFATLVAAALGDWVIPFIYNTGFPGFRTSILPWVFMGGLIALEQRLRRRA